MTTETPEQQRMIDEAVNTKGFLEFMSAHPNSNPEDINDPKLVAERIETFRRKEEVKSEVVSIFSEQIEKDFDIRLDTKDKESIGAYIDKQAIGDPGNIERLGELISRFKALPNEIASLTGQIKNLGTIEEQESKVTKLKTDAEQLKIVRDGNRFMGASRLIKRLFPKKFDKDDTNPVDKKMIEEYGNKIKLSAGLESVSQNIQSKIDEIEKNLQFTYDLKDAISKFDAARSDLLTESSKISELVESIKRRVREKLENKLKLSDTSTKSAGTQEEFAKFVQTSANTETNITPLTQAELDDYQKQLNNQIEKQVSDEIMEFFTTKIDASSTNRFSKLEKYIEPYINLDKLGSGDKEKARAIIKKALTDSVASIDKSPDSDIRRMMVARIIAKYNL